MILCDTNILINAFNGNHLTISQLEEIGFENIVLSSITVMELLQGMRNKTEMAQMNRKIKYYDIIHLDSQISLIAIELIQKFKLSHNLQIPDAIIGATSISNNLNLFTYNIKDFNFMPGLILHKH